MRKLEFIFNNGKKVELMPPSVESYYKIYHAVDSSEETEGLCEWLGSTDTARAYIAPIDVIKAKYELSRWLAQLRKREEYRAPHVEGDVVTGTQFTTVYFELKTVSDYTHDSFTELKKMDVLCFWRLYRDAIIYNCSKSEDGKAYLEKAYASVQTKPDRAAIAQIIAMQK